MNPTVLVVFSTITGNGYKLACAASEALPNFIGPYNIRYITDEMLAEYDIVLLSYWCDKGTADKDTIDLIHRMQGKKVIIIGTAGVARDSEHAAKVSERVRALVSEENELLGEFLCQGAIDLKRTAKKLLLPEGQRGHMTPERFERQKLSQGHPDAQDLEDTRAAVREAIAKVRG